MWKRTETGYFEVEGGTPTGRTHPYTYAENSGHILRVKHNADNTTAAEIFPRRCFITFDAATGEIKSGVSGFVLAYELDGIDAFPREASEDVIEVAAIPDRLLEDYIVNVGTKTLTRRG